MIDVACMMWERRPYKAEVISSSLIAPTRRKPLIYVRGFLYKLTNQTYHTWSSLYQIYTKKGKVVNQIKKLNLIANPENRKRPGTPNNKRGAHIVTLFFDI